MTLRWLNRLLTLPLKAWHYGIGPLFPPSCRFHPSCSVYAIQALDRYPLRRAIPLILKRVARCHPFHPGGFDPLPDDPPTPAPGASTKAD